MAPGRKTGGRKPNTANKLSAARVAEARAQGKKLPPESLLLIAENSLAMAARYQPELTDQETRERRKSNTPNKLGTARVADARASVVLSTTRLSATWSIAFS
jgi:hypothetical protein